MVRLLSTKNTTPLRSPHFVFAGDTEAPRSRRQPPDNFTADRRIHAAQNRAEHESHEQIDASP
jgi:hypothetical protein